MYGMSFFWLIWYVCSYDKMIWMCNSYGGGVASMVVGDVWDELFWGHLLYNDIYLCVFTVSVEV